MNDDAIGALVARALLEPDIFCARRSYPRYGEIDGGLESIDSWQARAVVLALSAHNLLRRGGKVPA